MSNSPWGPIQDVEHLAPGMDFVMTASHGGIRVTREAAYRLLTSAALKCAIEKDGYFFFEEDCNYVIVMYEIPWLRCKVFGPEINKVEEHILSSLKRWNASYLEERGVLTEDENERTDT